jgi:CheY-like chemotaxis protein
MATIVVVEDDPHIAELLAQILEDDHTVVRAANGALGVEAVRKHQPDVVVMDLTMPVMDGTSAIRELRRDLVTSRIPVIALSATREAEDISRAIASGADAYVPKPIDAVVLTSTITRLLKRPPALERLSGSSIEAAVRGPKPKR